MWMWLRRLLGVLSLSLPLVVSLAASAPLAGCSDHEAARPPAPTADAPTAENPTKPMLPAWPLPGERHGSGKADGYDTFRLNNPSVYGITEAPKTPMRTPAQYAKAKYLLLGWTNQVHPTIAGIVKGAIDVVKIIVVHDGGQDKQAFLQLMAQNGVDAAKIAFYDYPLDSLWMRDYGPYGVRTPAGRIALVDFKYYHQRVYDDAVPAELGADLGLLTYRAPLSWEGGNFMSDGQGNCYFSQGVYWYGGVSADQAHDYMSDYLGCTTHNVLQPLAGEGTTHIDMFSKLVSKNRVVVGKYADGIDSENQGILNDNAAKLSATLLNDGSTLEVVRIPMGSNKDGVWRTYANSLLVNGKNLVPVFTNSKTYEAEALAVWKSAAPDFEVVPVDSTQLIGWGGAVHCITMTIAEGDPAPVEAAPPYLCGGDFSCKPADAKPGKCPLPFEGCCGPDGVHSCENGKVVTTGCGAGNCGFASATMAYGCGQTGAGPANAPLTCGAACVPQCKDATGATKQCGSDGCGGTCGTCPSGTTCESGVCKAPPDPCGGVSYQGCCKSGALQYCSQGQVKSESCGGGTCGWDTNGNNGKGWYDCGYQGADPSGQNAIACPGACTPACTNADGSARQCGPNGCGGTCGSCSGGALCAPDGKCLVAAGDCGAVTYLGTCQGTALLFCKDQKLVTFECTSKGNFGCGMVPGSAPASFDCLPGAGPCATSCSGKVCGPDGCGGECGACGVGAECNAGACQPSANACGTLGAAGACDGTLLKQCKNGTEIAITDCAAQPGGGSCGQGPQGMTCLPVACVPSCDGPNGNRKSCGSDGCSGSCGLCAAGTVCEAGSCAPLPSITPEPSPDAGPDTGTMNAETGAGSDAGGAIDVSGGGASSPDAGASVKSASGTSAGGCASGARNGPTALLMVLGLAVLLWPRRRSSLTNRVPYR